MGIRGLSTYISQNSNHFYQPFRLHDCTLVIDGCSLACQLYIRTSGCNSAFGGDYDRYAKALENFLALLQQCNVTPLVVVDGGYEVRKLKTINRRFKEKIHRAKICNPANHSPETVFPLLLMEVFKQTLISQEIKFVQTDFEADYEIAAISRYLSCPVLSNDSDFYIYDVLYIPFPTLNLVPLKIQKKGCFGYYLNCEVYKVEKLFSKFGGLDKRLLPLVAVLLGNDYVPSSTFSTFFYNHVMAHKSKKMSQEKKLVAIFEWLKEETLQSATRKVLNLLKKKDRSFVEHQIEILVCNFSYSSSELIAYFGLQAMNSDFVTTPEAQLLQCNDNIPDRDCDSSEDYNSSDGSGHKNISDDEAECEHMNMEEFRSHVLPSPARFPLWLKDKFRRGELPSFIADICHLRLYFCQPQVEDFTMNDSHFLSFPILQVICGLLLSDMDEQSVERENWNLICYTRGASSNCQIIELQPTWCLQCLPCSSLPSLPLSFRKNIFYSTLNINVKDRVILESFGGKWELFASVVVFWARSAVSPNVTNCHLQAVIICMIALGVVDEKLGRICPEKEIAKRKTQSLTKQNIKIHSKPGLLEQRNEDCGLNLHTNQNLAESLDDCLSKVSESECLSLLEFFLLFHHSSGNVRSSPQQFSPFVVHLFAQLQACLFQAMSLNSLLDYPVRQWLVSQTFSGSVTYNAFLNFNKRRDVETYIRAQMTCSPSVYTVYKAILDRFLSLIPNALLSNKGTKKSKKKKHKKSVVRNSENNSQVSEESNLDVNNKFAVLSALSSS